MIPDDSVLREVLIKDGVCRAAEDVGGTVSRAAQLDRVN